MEDNTAVNDTGASICQLVHDLNNQLSVVLGMSQLNSTFDMPPEQAKLDWAKVAEAGLVSRTIAQKLQDLGRQSSKATPR